MAELDIGQHCSVDECKQLDFLPFLCDGCGRVFCREHQNKEVHSCSRHLLPLTKTSQPSTPYTTYSCSLTGCSKTELVPVVCDQCARNFCMQHRHASDHSCPGVVVKPKSMSLTAQHVDTLLATRQGTTTSRPAPKSKRARQMAAKVALMKLKQNSTGNAGIPAESRVYLSIQLPSTDSSAGSSPAQMIKGVWIDKQWTVGRSVDFISDKFGVRNENNKPDQPRLTLRSIETGSIYGMEFTLQQLLDKEDIFNGSSLQLCYVDL